MAALTCPDCGTPFTPDHVNVALGIASCAPCGKVHDLAARRGPRSRGGPADGSGVVEREGSEPSLSWSWRGAQVLFLILWCMVWDFGLLTLVTTAVQRGEGSILLFGSVHGVVGIAMTYYTLALLVNRTEVVVTAGELVVQHGPLPWFAGRRLTREDIEQIWVEEVVSSKGARSYKVHAVLTFGSAELVSGLGAGRARFVEDWVERRLKIADAPVAGELV